jgi:transcription initiation factor TFIID subunit TAF12
VCVCVCQRAAAAGKRGGGKLSTVLTSVKRDVLEKRPSPVFVEGNREKLTTIFTMQDAAQSENKLSRFDLLCMHARIIPARERLQQRRPKP